MLAAKTKSEIRNPKCFMTNDFSGWEDWGHQLTPAFPNWGYFKNILPATEQLSSVGGEPDVAAKPNHAPRP
jgi:hypothetical protein